MENFDIGATNASVTFPDLIINAVTSVAGGGQQGFENVVFNPRQLIQQTNQFSSMPPTKEFTEAITFRNKYTKIISENYNFPFCSSLINAVPTPWALFQTTIDNQSNNNYVFNISRIPDFVGKNYIYFKLPAVDLPSSLPPTITDINNSSVEIPSNRFLGAWHNDLIPRIIKNVIIRSKTSGHESYSYSGLNIWLHNILFNNKSKMFDMLSGQDYFELVYDPFDFSNVVNPYYQSNSQLVINDVSVNNEFKYIYGKYYENPVMRNSARTGHSIHERLLRHEEFTLAIPLDILPIGSNLQNSIPTAALGTDTGFITVEIYDDWFNRAFYLVNTAVSGLAVQQGTTLATNYSTYTGNLDVYNAVLPVNTTPITVDTKVQTTDKADQVGAVALTGLNLLGASADQAVNNGTTGLTLPVKIDNHYAPYSPEPFSAQHIKVATKYTKPDASGSVTMPSVARSAPRYNISTPNDVLNVRSNLLDEATESVDARAVSHEAQQSYLPAEISRTLQAARYQEIAPRQDTCWNGNWYLYTPKDIRSASGNLSAGSFFELYKSKYAIKLLQSGYYMLNQIKDLLTKYPSLFLATTWDSQEFDIDKINEMKISNDAYIQALAFTFISDENNIEFYTVYPHQLVNAGFPMIGKMQITTETQQGTVVNDWTTLNKIIPYQANIQRPLPTNVGLFTFAPVLTESNFPLAFYDMNIYGSLTIKVSNGNEKYIYTDALGNPVNKIANLKRGKLVVTSIGSNGLLIMNLSMTRLIF